MHRLEHCVPFHGSCHGCEFVLEVHVNQFALVSRFLPHYPVPGGPFVEGALFSQDFTRFTRATDVIDGRFQFSDNDLILCHHVH